MNISKISEILDKLRVSKKGRIIGKYEAVKEIKEASLSSLDREIMNIRVFVQGCKNLSTEDALSNIDEYLYNKQIKL